MKQSCSRGTLCIFLTTFLLTGYAFLALFFTAGQSASAEPTPAPTPPPVIRPVTYYSGTASISTANCNGSGGLCQASPACNNGAGPNPANIQASVTLCETRPGGTLLDSPVGTLRIRGTGTGFQFGKTYVSLLYLNGNPATCSRFPAGVPPTLQNLSQADSDFASMHLGFWVVNPDGSATLTLDKEATLTGLNKYQTVSVREMQPPNAVCYNCALDPAPQLNALRACGALTVGEDENCAIP
jgi:hypothetical protein